MKEIKSKECTRCREIKPLSEFYQSKYSKDNKQSYCSSCSKELKRRWKINRQEVGRIKNIRSQKEISKDIESEIKRCPYCGKDRLFSDFYKDRGRADGVSYSCRECLKISSKEIREDKPGKVRRSRREVILRSKYNISQQDYDLLLSSQGNKCCICGTSAESYTRSGKSVPLAVDHCHSTGKVRGLLCNQCNIGIGNLKDNPEVIKNALEYLLLHKEKSIEEI